MVWLLRMLVFAVVVLVLVVDTLVDTGHIGGSTRSAVLVCIEASCNLNRCSSQTGLLDTRKEGRIRIHLWS